MEVTGRKLSGPMRILLRLVSVRPLSLRRLWALGLLVLLGVLCASPVWESRGEIRMGAHSAQQGTHHAKQHLEETCEVCSVRALQATAPAPSAVAVNDTSPARVDQVRRESAPSSDLSPTALSRAPPAIG